MPQDWTDIDPNFAKDFLTNKTYQQIWEDSGLTVEDARKWLPSTGLKVRDFELVSQLKIGDHNPQEFSDKFKEKRDAQEWVDFFYPKEKRKDIVELDISSKRLEGPLDLTDFTNLEWFNCSINNLTKLSVDNSSRSLNYLNCSYNNLSDVKFITDIKCPDKLIYLDLRNNCFSPSDLKVFTGLVNLEKLYLGTTEYFRVLGKQYNDFFGSLMHLKDLKNLKELCIRDTTINRGFEYLPNNLKKLFISSTREKDDDLGLAEIVEELEAYGYDFQNWKKSEAFLARKENKELKRKLEISKDLIGTLRENCEDLKKKLAELTSALIEETGNKNDALKELEELREEKSNSLQGKLERKIKNNEQATSRMINIQEWLDKEYPKENRNTIRKLDIAEKNLEGSLLLEEFSDLTALYFQKNQIIQLELPKDCKIDALYVYSNKLSSLDFLSQLQPEKVKYLRIGDNDFPSTDINYFSSFVKLKTLAIENSNFFGNLEELLKKLPELDFLDISNTKVEVADLKHFPNNLVIYYSSRNSQQEKREKMDRITSCNLLLAKNRL